MRCDPYESSARWYDGLIEPLLSATRQKALELWPPRPGMVVLDMACGTGTLLARYAEAGCEVHGIDASPAMISAARRKLGGSATLHLGDIADAPYDRGSFDLVTFSMALHEMPDGSRLAALEEARRVLSDDGRVLVVDYHRGPAGFPTGWLIKALVDAVERSAGKRHYHNYQSFVASGGVAALAAPYELRLARSRIIGEGNLGLYLLQRARP